MSFGDRRYELLAWGPEDAVPPALRDFWSVCGGIVERFNEPATWWLNHDEVLTPSVAFNQPGMLAEMVDAYSWIWEKNDLVAPTEEVLRSYVTVAIEGNANMTVAHRETGQLLLFAPDHAFDGITPWAGCPEYSLYTFDELPDLAAWIEVCAAAWRCE